MLLPADATIDRARRIVTWRPRGVLSAPMVHEIHVYIAAEEAALGAFQRFTDLSALEGIHLTFLEIEEIAHSRIESYRGCPVKSAIFAPTPLAFGLARMYEQLMRRSPIEVGVFSELEAAAAWLGMPVEFLTAAS
jgi:hypothetical protein